jgi:hypothetical protein
VDPFFGDSCRCAINPSTSFSTASLLSALIGGVIATLLSTLGIRKWDRREKRKQLAKEYGANVRLFRKIHNKVSLLSDPKREIAEKTNEVASLRVLMSKSGWCAQLERNTEEGDIYRKLKPLYDDIQRTYDELITIGILSPAWKIWPIHVASCYIDFEAFHARFDRLISDISTIEKKIPFLKRGGN